jgi:hypothetical protein
MPYRQLRPRIDRARVWPKFPSMSTADQIVFDSAFRLGTLEEAIGVEQAEEFFRRPNPFEDARKSAAMKLGYSAP